VGSLEVTYTLHLQLVGKPVIDFPFVIIGLFSLALTVDALQGKMCQSSLLFGGVGQLEPRFQGKSSSLGDIFDFYKTRHILLSDSANCTVLHTVVLTQYRRVIDERIDRQTDGWNCYS